MVFHLLQLTSPFLHATCPQTFSPLAGSVPRAKPIQKWPNLHCLTKTKYLNIAFIYICMKTAQINPAQTHSKTKILLRYHNSSSRGWIGHAPKQLGFYAVMHQNASSVVTCGFWWAVLVVRVHLQFPQV